MMFSRTHKRLLTLSLLIGVLVVVCGAALPTLAHAADDPITNGILSKLLGTILAGLTLVTSSLGQLLKLVQEALKFILTLPIVSSIPVVQTSWKILRDFCNMLFIVILVIISFATIFDAATGKLKQFYYSTALVPLIIGAIVINFSLAIGQTITLASNQVAQVFINIMPDMGNQLIQILKPQQFALSGTSTADAPKNLTDAEVKRYKDCLNEVGKDASASWVQGLTFVFTGATPELRKTVNDCNLEIIKVRNAPPEQGTLTKLYNLVVGKTKVEEQFALIMSAIGASVMMVMIISCLATAFVFLLYRILVIWILLAISPLAWFSYSVPGSDGFGKWWKQFIAWNVFGPLYLFCLVPGIIMLQGSGEILTALNNTGAGSTSGMIQVFMSYAFAIMIFIGGVTFAVKGSYAATLQGTGFVGKQLAKFGVFDTAGMAPARVAGRGAAFISEQTGLNNRIQARKDQFNQAKEDLLARARGRFPRILGTKEEGLAAARARVGIRGADIEFEKEIAKRVKTQKDIIEAKISKLGKPEQAAELEKLRTGPNRDTALAAGEIMLGKGTLDTASRESMLKKYEDISPTAKKEFQKRVTDQYQKEAGKTVYGNFAQLKAAAELSGKSSEDRRKFLESAIRGETGQKMKLSGGEMLDLAGLMKDGAGNADAESQRAFLDTATKSGRNKVAAIETMARLGLLVDRNGEPVREDAALAERAETFSGDDLLDADAYYATAGRDMPPGVQEAYKKAAANPSKYASMAAHANPRDPAQLQRLQETNGIIQTRSIKGEKRVIVVRKLKSALSEAQRQQKKVKEKIEKLKEKKSKLNDPGEILATEFEIATTNSELKKYKQLAEKIEERAIKIEKEAKELQK